MTKHHEPFKALGPIDWPASSSPKQLPELLINTFADAQTVIDSLPMSPFLLDHRSSSSSSRNQKSRLRSQTESSSAQPSKAAGTARENVLPPGCGGGGDRKKADKIRAEWKEVKINPRDNPLDISVCKLSAKDGRGSWFARRSVHYQDDENDNGGDASGGLSFDRWKLAIEREFAESLRQRKKMEGKTAAGAKPGDGSVRGIGAERRVEREAFDGIGRAEVYQLSAQFPGPTTPRDFVTLLLLSSNGDEEGSKGQEKQGGDDKMSRGIPSADNDGIRPMRQLMVVSKPCNHSDCAARPGFIRGYYESVEVIREIPLPRKVAWQSTTDRTVRSSTDLGRDITVEEKEDHARTGTRTAVEWLMVTRSDPGGNVPRFMVERGTPSGIVSDAGRFLDWARKMKPETFASHEEKETGGEDGRQHGQKHHPSNYHRRRTASESTMKIASTEKASNNTVGPTSENEGATIRRRNNTLPVHTRPCKDSQSEEEEEEEDDDDIQYPGGFYSVIASALGAAGSAVASRLPQNPFVGAEVAGEEDGCGDSDEDNTDDRSSIRSFASAVEPSSTMEATETSLSHSPPPSEGTGVADQPKEDMQARGDKDSIIPSKTPPSSVTTAGLPSPPSSSDKKNNHGLAHHSSPHHDKELRKLDGQRAKLSEKLSRMEELRSSGGDADSILAGSDAVSAAISTQSSSSSESSVLAAAAHVRSRAQQLGQQQQLQRSRSETKAAKLEEKYRKEMDKLDRKRAQQEEKVRRREEKRQRSDDRRRLQLTVEKLTAERDMALRQAEVQMDTIGELQRENTALVAQLGRLGVGSEDVQVSPIIASGDGSGGRRRKGIKD